MIAFALLIVLGVLASVPELRHLDEVSTDALIPLAIV